MGGMNQNNIQRLDANETAFFKRQLEYVKTRTYDKKYKNLKSKQFIPVSTETPSGTEFVIWYSWAKIGVAHIIANYAKDFPRADVYAEEHQSKIWSIGAGYGYNIQEIRRAQRDGTNLTQRRATAARDAHEIKQDNIAWYGEEEFGLQGFFNYPGITEFTVPVGDSASKLWSTKTPDEINLDMVGIMNSITVPTKGLQAPNQMLIDRENYTLISNLRMTGNSDTTVLEYFRRNNPGVAVDVLDELAGVGVGGTNRFFAYEKDLDVLEQDIPQMFEQFDPDKEGMEYKIPCHSQSGGVRVFRPQAIAYGDGV